MINTHPAIANLLVGLFEHPASFVIVATAERTTDDASLRIGHSGIVEVDGHSVDTEATGPSLLTIRNSQPEVASRLAKALAAGTGNLSSGI